MQIITWNVNGIRAAIKNGFHGFLKKQKPDIICLQEIKISHETRSRDKEKHNIDFLGYDELWNSAKRPGYSGTAILIKEGIKYKALPNLDWDDEGRIQVVDLGKFYLANIYFPNANHELSRLKFKLDFNDKLLKFLKTLDKKKSVVVAGDFNVAHNEIDLKNPKINEGNAGFTRAERDWMTKFLQTGFVDIFRQMYKNKVQYTWWSYRFGARARNIGWRIDYFCVSKSFLKYIEKIEIMDKVQGSDHCPVRLTVE